MYYEDDTQTSMVVECEDPDGYWEASPLLGLDGNPIGYYLQLPHKIGFDLTPTKDTINNAEILCIPDDVGIYD